ncbi:MAG: MFS transporter [Gemmatimonadota bacterium]|nr:MAG: MFS transporter [Gemmatimonadota bacterium]
MSRLTIIFLTIFIDLIGFGIVLPLLPFYAQDFGATPLIIGLIVAIHPAMQFLFGPLWGRLSDRVGRRPILLIGLLGSGLSYLLFALATNLGWLIASRIMQGIAGANIPVAQAYIADNTDLEDRTRGMGLVGAAFGLGVIAGPAIAGALVNFGYAVPGFFAAAISLVNAGAAYFYLPESLSPEARARAVARPAAGPLGRLTLAMRFARRPAIGTLMSIFLAATFVFAAFTTIFPLWIGVKLGYDARHAGYLLAYLGLIMAVLQGRLIGPLARQFGERRLLVAGTTTLIVAYLLLPLAGALVTVCAVLLLVAGGSGLNWPTLSSLASQYAEIDSQGAILGVMQSLSALGRMAGAAWAGWVFGAWMPAAPYLLSAAIMSLAAALAVLFMLRAPPPPAKAKPMAPI